MKEEMANRIKWLHLRLTQSEYDLLHKHFKQSTCRKLSEYGRRMLLAEPVIAAYHNQSLDDFMTEAIKLKKELNNIGNNFNQAVKKLHTLQQIAEFRNWMLTYDSDRQRVVTAIEEFKNRIAKISDLWLQ